MGLQRVISQLYHSKLVSSESKKMFFFGKKHPLFKKSGDLNADGLALVHLTDFAPTEDGVIQSAKDAIGWVRNSVHFALNHAAVPHPLWDGRYSRFAMILPLSKTIETKGNKIAGGVAIDLYSSGSVRMPKGSVIVRYNSNIPEGKYKISDAHKIQEFKKLKGIKVIETSNVDMQTVTDDIITKLGYEKKAIKNSMILKFDSENNKFEMFCKFNDFLENHNMRPMFHSYTPNGRTDIICENIGFRAAYKNTWIVKDKHGEMILDYKKKYIEILEDILEDANRYNYETEYDINKLIEIIRSSKTPRDAEQSILKYFNLKSLLKNFSGDKNKYNEYDIYQYLVYTDFDKNIVANVEKFLNNPSADVGNKINELSIVNQSKYFSSQHLSKIGLDEATIKSADNEIANKLYMLI